MTPIQTANLERGRDAWNSWARAMLTQRRQLEESGEWIDSMAPDAWNAATKAWHEEASVTVTTQSRYPQNLSGLLFPGTTSFAGCDFMALVDFRGTEFRGKVSFSQAKFPADAVFAESIFHDTADFDKATFCAKVDFEGVRFFRDASFNEVAFKAESRFEKVAFTGEAMFLQTSFLRDVSFEGAQFQSQTIFSETKFERAVRFDNATFSELAGFDQVLFAGSAQFQRCVFLAATTFARCVFQGPATFDKSAFRHAPHFDAIEAKSAFSLRGIDFPPVPNFIQSHFTEAPTLDGARFRKSQRNGIRQFFKGDLDQTVKWRALKRLAAQGLDHAHELDFFKNELLTRGRTGGDSLAVLAARLLYQWTSDFGRSITRPLVGWLASVAFFALIYCGPHLPGMVIPHLTQGDHAHQVYCEAVDGSPISAAFHVSISKATLFLGYGPEASDKLTLSYACLYGVAELDDSGMAAEDSLAEGRLLNVPSWVVLVGILQQAISAALVFLLLLAVRNHFRIR